MAQGIWQAVDRSPVNAAEAHREWTLRATEILTEVAGRFGRSIEYADLGAEVQRRAGILTDRGIETWLDLVLREVGRRCAEAGKPSLTLLVEIPDVRVDPAARASVHEAYGAKLPKARAPRTTRSRASAGAEAGERSRRPSKPAERRRPLCPTCFVELPSTGICDNCA